MGPAPRPAGLPGARPGRGCNGNRCCGCRRGNTPWRARPRCSTWCTAGRPCTTTCSGGTGLRGPWPGWSSSATALRESRKGGGIPSGKGAGASDSAVLDSFIASPTDFYVLLIFNSLSGLQSSTLSCLFPPTLGKSCLNSPGAPRLMLVTLCYSRLLSRILERDYSYIAKVLKGTEEVALPAHPRYLDTFNDTSVHWFPPQKLKELSPEVWDFREEPTYKDCEDLEIIRREESAGGRSPAAES
uniref:Uncharacterized protein n=1 Tax=Athene cunicularia TaxID=194338 RepID=A0A663MV16_ATHCN